MVKRFLGAAAGAKEGKKKAGCCPVLLFPLRGNFLATLKQSQAGNLAVIFPLELNIGPHLGNAVTIFFVGTAEYKRLPAAGSAGSLLFCFYTPPAAPPRLEYFEETAVSGVLAEKIQVLPGRRGR